MDFKTNLLQRWKPEWNTKYAAAKFALDRALDAGEKVRATRASLDGNRDLSDEGKRNSIRKFLTESTAPALRHTGKSLEKMRQRVDARIAQLQPKPPADNDSAAAMRRSEYRQMLRGMSP